jgi:hypothetical protein
LPLGLVDEMNPFGPLLLGRDTERKLPLFTAKGNPIENVIELDPNDRTRKIWAYQRQRHPLWEERKPDTGVYNCAGMVWASRRTSIMGEYHKILADDGYRLLRAGEECSCADLVLYKNDVGTHMHVGVVILKPGIMGGRPNIPAVLSKWNSVSGEYVHSVNDHPLNGDVSIEIWTDRP